MRVRRYFYAVLIAILPVFLPGCTNVDSVVRSVERTFMVKKQAEIDATILDEARSAQDQGNLILAEDRYLEYVERNHRSEDKASLAYAYSQLGRIAHDKSDFRASNRYFDKALEYDPENLNTRGMYAESLYFQKDYKRAESLSLQNMQIAPNDPRFQIVMGRTLAEQKHYQAGLRYLKTALGEQRAYEELASICDKHEEYEQAALAMSKARESQNRQRQRQLAGNSTMRSIPSQSQPRAGSIPSATQERGAFAADTAPRNSNQVVFIPRIGGPSDNLSAGQQSAGAMQVQNNQPYQYPQTAQQQAVPQQQMQYYQAPQPAMTMVPETWQPGMQPVVQPSSVQPQYAAQQQPYPVQQPYPYPSAHNNTQANPVVQQVPGTYYVPQQQVYQPNPPQQQDNRPPSGFATVQWQPPAQEIAYHPNYPQHQPGVSSQAMPAQYNPLAERHVFVQPPTQSQTPVFTGYPTY